VVSFWKTVNLLRLLEDDLLIEAKLMVECPLDGVANAGWRDHRSAGWQITWENEELVYILKQADKDLFNVETKSRKATVHLERGSPPREP
jgi:hypothetical protein